jgi:hypothetical protein
MLYCAFLMHVTVPTPLATGRLLAVSPDMAQLMVVVTLRDTSLGFVRLYPDSNTARARQFQFLMGLRRPS